MKIKLKYPLILASGSPRRQQLLEESGYEFKVFKPEIEELIDSDWKMRDVALNLAKQKASFAFQQIDKKGIQVLAADTIVITDGQILGKPKGKEDAASMLRQLSNKVHEVHTGVSLIGPVTKSGTCITKVRFLGLNENEINFYLDTYKPYDKAGSYGVQEWLGHCKIDKITGSFPNVMGLPVHLVYEFLSPIMEELGKP